MRYMYSRPFIRVTTCFVSLRAPVFPFLSHMSTYFLRSWFLYIVGFISTVKIWCDNQNKKLCHRTIIQRICLFGNGLIPMTDDSFSRFKVQRTV